MKKALLSLLIAICTFTLSSAQITKDGYYRVKSKGLENRQGKTAYCCITFGTCKINTAAGSAQYFEPIALWSHEEVNKSDPAAIIYITNPTSENSCNLQAQGANVRTMFSGSLKLTGTQDNYRLLGTYAGTSAYLYCTSTSDFDGADAHFIMTTSTTNGYDVWSIYSVDSNTDDNYFGVKPTLEANGKYYAPYYVSFPFRTISEGMKVYYVSYADDSRYELKEIKGIVPAATPVLIECSYPESTDNRLELLKPGTYSAPTGNKLSGVYFSNKFVADGMTKFDAKTMRVWDVQNGKLVLSTSTSRLTKNDLSSIPSRQYYALNANQSYLPVASTAKTVLVPTAETTISFDTDGGSTVEDITGTSGSTVSVPANPTKEGNTFAGWVPSLPSVFPAENLTVKATWTPNTYEVIYLSDGKIFKEEEFVYGSTPTITTDQPTKEGYTFKGWSTTLPPTMPANNITLTAQWEVNKYKVIYLSDGKTFKEEEFDYGTTPTTTTSQPTKDYFTFKGWDKQLPASMPANDITINALWEANKYKIIYISDGKTYKEEEFAYGSQPTLTTAPTKEGYTFKGWDKALPATMPHEDVILTAQWEINKYKVEFISEGTVFSSQILEYGAVITKPTKEPTKDGTKFLGWKNNDGTNAPFMEGVTVPAHDVTYVATFDINIYTITFNTAGGTEIPAITAKYGTTVTEPAAPEREGYTFKEWQPAIPETIPAGNITITAQWTPKKYTVSYESDGKIVHSEELDYKSVIVKPTDITKEGHTLIGWYPDVTTVPLNGITLTAQWQANDYKVIYKVDGNTYKEVSFTYGTATSLIPDIPTKVGHTFKGWDTTLPATMPASDITLTAQWEVNKYKIYYLSDGNIYKEEEFAYGSTPTLTANPTKEGYTFQGWDIALPTTMPANDITLTALWQVNKYKVIYVSDGKTFKEEEFTYGTKPTITTDQPTKEGYDFKGWDTKLPATMPANDITITAQWTLTRLKKQIHLNAGWNWVGFNVQSSDTESLTTALGSGSWTNGDEIKNAIHAAAYSPTYSKWIGTLATNGALSRTAMYKVYSTNEQTLTLKEGKVILPSTSPLDVKSGWNYICFLPFSDLLVDEALATYEACDGDVIKSQDAYATYSAASKAWKGDLKVLKAGQGYMMMRNTTTSTTFCFPDEGNSPVTAEEPVSKAKRAFASNMNVTALLDGIETESGDEVVAYANGEIRGTGMVAEDGRVYLTIQGDQSQNVSLSLLREGSVVAYAKSPIHFEADAVVGSYDAPAAITFVDDDNNNQPLIGKIIAIYSLDGTKLSTTDLSSLTTGIYLVHSEGDGKTIITKIVK